MFAALVALPSIACDKGSVKPPVKLGEPIGVRVDDVKDASGKRLGNLQAAFAITAGQAAEPLVPGVARVLDRVAKQCPALLTKGADPVHVQGATTMGALSFPAVPGESAEQKCLREAMQGQKITDAAISTDIAVEIRPESGG